MHKKRYINLQELYPIDVLFTWPNQKNASSTQRPLVQFRLEILLADENSFINMYMLNNVLSTRGAGVGIGTACPAKCNMESLGKKSTLFDLF